MSFWEQVPLDRLGGLRPRAWLCVGTGFSREDFKAQLLERGLGFTGEAVTSLQAIALKIVGRAVHDPGFSAGNVLGGLARQEVLRILMGNARIASRLPELKKLKRQTGFFKKLDLALQAGRLTFSHADEGAVYAEWLQSRVTGSGTASVRAELQTLSLAYEAWLESEKLLDPPMLLSRATEILNLEGWPEGLSRPETIYVFSAQTDEGRERGFWETLSRFVEVVPIGPLHQKTRPQLEAEPSLGPWKWQLWHTLDDAAEELVDRLVSEESTSHYRDCVVLIPDTSSARRTLTRALTMRGVPLADPRDPTRMRWDESVKLGALPLRVVASSFGREEVVSFLTAFRSGFMTGATEHPRWCSEIHARGIRRGLGSYSGGRLALVHAILVELDEAMGGKKTCAELGEAHLKALRGLQASVDGVDRSWLLPFYENVWREFTADMQRVGLGERVAPALYWWERLQSRLSESPPPIERFKPEAGVAIYRLSQAPLLSTERVYVLGLPPRWLSGEGVGDYWFSERDREALSGEFAVRSGITQRQERLAALQAWIASAWQVRWLDAAYDSDGRERETIASALKELAASLELPAETVPDAPEEKGAHPRWTRSYGALRPIPKLVADLDPLPRGPGGAVPEITATALDSYSRCGFQALAYQRWKLRELKDPDTELWPEARGTILHAAVKVLLESRDADGNFGLSTREALDRAWELEYPRGLIRTPRTERYVRERMVRVLDTFLEKEREYFSRAPSKIASLDSAYFSLKFDEVSILGMPDRIDQHPEGLFVLDYKTSISLPNGADMLELGYRLQLPFYALAASASLGQPVLGVQFVELNAKGGRGAGLFFKKYNGKEPGKLTTLTARSKSLLMIEPEDAWPRLEDAVRSHAAGFVSGSFDAVPKKDKECATCSVADFCGLRRLTERLPREVIWAQHAPRQAPVPTPDEAPDGVEAPTAVGDASRSKSEAEAPL